MFGKKKVEASVTLYANGECTVKGNVLGVAKMYIGCMQILLNEGIDIEKLNGLKDMAKIIETKKAGKE